MRQSERTKLKANVAWIDLEWKQFAKPNLAGPETEGTAKLFAAFCLERISWKEPWALMPQNGWSGDPCELDEVKRDGKD